MLNQEDKELVIDILFETFLTNKSTNFVIKQDKKKEDRLRFLLEYSYFLGEKFGKIYLTPDKKGAGIILYPEKKKTSLSTIWWDIKLISKSIGIKKLLTVFKREAALKKLYPKTAFVHLWYVGVKQSDQGKKIGTNLIQEMIKDANGKLVYLETSNNLVFPLYERIGFKNSAELTFDDYYLRIYQFS